MPCRISESQSKSKGKGGTQESRDTVSMDMMNDGAMKMKVTMMVYARNAREDQGSKLGLHRWVGGKRGRKPEVFAIPSSPRPLGLFPYVAS